MRVVFRSAPLVGLQIRIEQPDASFVQPGQIGNFVSVIAGILDENPIVVKQLDVGMPVADVKQIVSVVGLGFEFELTVFFVNRPYARDAGDEVILFEHLMDHSAAVFH